MTVLADPSAHVPATDTTVVAPPVVQSTSDTVDTYSGPAGGRGAPDGARPPAAGRHRAAAPHPGAQRRPGADRATDRRRAGGPGGPLDNGFAALGLPDRLVRALAAQGIDTPFDIQTAAVPDALAGRDVLGRGQTGSGKTLAFGLPALTRLAAGERPRPGRPRGLVLVPTRELAMQVADALVPLGRALGVFVRTAVGGVPYDRQIEALRRGVGLLVATPGRLGDLIRRGSCTLAEVGVTVLDEADQMADMGFLPEVTQLLEQTPPTAQRLLFSATLDNDVDLLVRTFMRDPVTHSTAPPVATVSTMDHQLLLIPPPEKFRVAASIAARQGRTIMFVRTQAGVDRLAGQLAEVGVRAGALHGGKHQRVRTRTLAEFREGQIDVLVATDVAARGIHVDSVSLVVHIDPPRDAKDYLHRAGRTARAGESGAVVTLVLPKQRRSTLAMLERAGVTPGQTRVRGGDPALAELTGAREPSGIPIPAQSMSGRDGRPEHQGRGGRDERSGYEGRSGRGAGYDPRAGRDGRGGRDPRTGRDGRAGRGAVRGGLGQSDRPRSAFRQRADRHPADRSYAERHAGERHAGERHHGERHYLDRHPTQH